jgi:NAD(P)-dependent dehydrogenase (short-subunit alcohol dehydrogenase family)
MKNKTILITGGTTGIGLATAQLLQSEGAQVIVTGRNPDTLASAKAVLGSKAILIKSDSASLADAQALGAEVAKHTAKLDGAFLNAGIAQFVPFADTTPKQYEDMFNVNVRGVYFQLQSLAALLANPSSVVITASVAAQLGLATASVYAATKAAVVSLGKTLAVELAPRGIRVNVVSPGPIKTPIFGKMGGTAEAQSGVEDYMASRPLVKRLGTGDEVAGLVSYLLSDKSSFVYGSEFLVDGGVRFA